MYAIGLIACHNDEDKVNQKLLNSLVKSLSYLTFTIEDDFFRIGLESNNMKPNALIRTHLGPVWYMCLKTENCCLKTFVEIRVGEKVY